MKKVLAVAVLAMMLQGTAFADAPEVEMMNMLKSMQKQMSQMQSTIDRQSSRIQELESSRSYSPTAQPAAQTSAPQLSEADWEKGIKDNIGNALPYLKGVKMGGDLRLRAENFNYYEDDFDDGESVTSDTRDRTRYRFRLRWGVEKDFGDDWKVGFRLASATASTTNPIATDNTSTNVTLGNPGYFSYKNIYIDRAYATYSPNGLKDYGALKGVTIGAGKFDNPFLRYSTPIIWDGDVTPEGVYEKASIQLLSSEENKLYAHLLAGQFITHENSGAETDAQLFGYQGALNLSTYMFGTDAAVDISSAVSYYDYPNYFQTIGATNNTATSFLRTNTSALDNPKVLDFYNEQVIPIGGWPVTFWEDVVTNVGSIDGTRAAIHEAHDDDFAWGVGVKVGKMKKKKDWEFHYGYYEIGANAVVAAFNDSDFGGPGGVGHTNRAGHKFGLGLLLTDNVSLNYTGFLVRVKDPTNSAVIAANAADEKVFRSQIDLLWKF